MGWEVAFSVVRNNRKRTEYVRINSGTFSNNNVSFQVVDIDDQESVVYIQRIGKTERIPCRVRQPIYEPLCRVKLLNTLDDTPIASQVGETFKLGSASVGEEEYRIEFADPDKKIAVVVSVGETKELFSLSFVKDFLPVVSQLPAGSAASAPPADKKP